MKRTLFSLMLLLGLVLTPAAGAMAQPEATDQTYISQITGDEIDLGTSGQISWLVDDFDFRETPSFQEEYIWFTYGWSNFQIVLIDGPNDPETYHLTTLGNMERFYDSWDLLGEEITDDGSWFLGAAEFSGSPLIVFYEFELDAFGDVDMAFMQFTDASTFQRDLEFVQGEVTIGGQPLPSNTDIAELVALTGAELDTPESSPEAEEDTGRTTRSSRTTTDATTDDDTDDEGTTPSRSSRTSTDTTTDDDDTDDEGTTPSRSSRTSTDATTDDDADDEGTTPSRTSRTSTDATTGDNNTSETSGSETDRESRTGRLGTSSTSDDPEVDEGDSGSTPVSGGVWSDMGLNSDSEWQSPTHGNVVTWDTASWAFPTDFDAAIIVSDDPPYDVLTLETVDGLGYVYITIDLPYESTPRNLIEYWVTEGYTSQIGNGVTVLETGTTSTSATMVYETTNTLDQPLIVVLEATFLDNGRVVFSQISAAPERIHEVYAQYAAGVQVDGAPLDLTFTVEEIQEISGN